MAFTESSSFKINPDVLYMDKGEKVVLTFATLEDKLYQVDQLAKDIFLMAINDFNYNQILQTALQSNLEKEKIQEEVDKLLSELIQMNILQLNA